MKSTSEVVEGVCAWAKGAYPLEAGVELLIRQGRAIYVGAPWLYDYGERVVIDVDELLEGTGAWSGGEQRVVRIAASLLGGDQVNLNDDVPGLDRPNLALVLAAIAHANGSHEHSEIRYSQDGTPQGFERVPSLYPWPASAADVSGAS